MPPKLYEQVNSLAKRLTAIANDMTFGIADEKQGMRGEKDQWLEAYHAVEKDVTPLFKAIVQETQKRLGIEDVADEDRSQQLKAEGKSDYEHR